MRYSITPDTVQIFTFLPLVPNHLQEVVNEVRRQFAEKPGIMTYTDKPDYARWVNFCQFPYFGEYLSVRQCACLSHCGCACRHHSSHHRPPTPQFHFTNPNPCPFAAAA